MLILLDILLKLLYNQKVLIFLIMNFFEKNSIQDRQGWLHSFTSGLCQQEGGEMLPWMPYQLIDYLRQELKETDVIFEFGYGTSSVFFANRVQKIFSIESNASWYKNFTTTAKEQMRGNITTILMSDALDNEEYENTPLEILANKPEIKGFDWIIVDSLKRAKCAAKAIDAINRRGRILLDDAQRSNYQKIYDFMMTRGFCCQEFVGVSPGQLKSKKSWIFYKKQ